MEHAPYCRSAKKWRVQACRRGAFVRLIGPNIDPPVWDCPAFGATTIQYSQYPVLSVPEIWHPAIQLEGSRSLRTHQRAAADDLEERTHLIGPIQQTAGSSRRQRMSFLKHKVGYKVHKGAIQADIDCTVGMAVGPQPQPSRAVMPPNAKSRRIPTLTRTANDARMLTKSYTLRPEAKKLGLTDSLEEGPIQSIILLSSQLWPIPSMSRRVFNSAKLCLSHPFSRMKRIDQWAVDPHPVLTSTTSAKIGKTA